MPEEIPEVPINVQVGPPITKPIRFRGFREKVEPTDAASPPDTSRDKS